MYYYRIYIAERKLNELTEEKKVKISSFPKVIQYPSKYRSKTFLIVKD
jgi:hypothetical protein